jgi:hypothetical protein
MGLFQVVDGFVLSDFSQFASTKKDLNLNQFPKELIDQIFEGPDNVKIGWAYDEKTNKFIPPTPSKGWAYDEETGTFYPTSNDLKAEIQANNFPQLYQAVVLGYLSKEVFYELTEQKFLEKEN